MHEIKGESGSTAKFDFSSVKSITTAFAKELFGTLWQEPKGEFGARVRLETGVANKPLTQPIVRGIESARRGATAAH